MLELKLQIKDLDYSALAELILPKVIEQKAKKEESGLFSKILQKTKGMSTGAAKAALGVLPQDMKDDLTASFLMHYREDIIKALYKLAKENNVKVEIGEIEVTKL
jgi:hypothetical protein